MILLDDLDASVYRSLIVGKGHVVIIGNQRLTPELHGRLSEACSGAVSTLIPEIVAAYLVERRERTAVPGMFVERQGTS